MPAFRPLPLGQPIPNRPHAVSCSLPRMADVRGYEEKQPATWAHLTSGYPRFVIHPFNRQLASHLETHVVSVKGRTLWLTSSARMAAALTAHLKAEAGPAEPFSHEGIHGVAHIPDPACATRAKNFLQNIGGFLSTRAAEDHLVRLGLITPPRDQSTRSVQAIAAVQRVLGQALPETTTPDRLLASCGMNAIYTAFRASADLQASRGRTVWVQLGWLYLDTIAILQRFTASTADYVYIRDPLDVDEIKRVFTQYGPRLAGVFAELPTNPLIQTPDITLLARLCRQHGAHLLIDPSVTSLFNLDVLRHSDIVVSSLTKYSASDGDLTAGVIAINPAGPDAGHLRLSAAAEVEPLYPRDLDRLAEQIVETAAVLRQIHPTTAAVVAFLQKHPRVRDVFWALHAASRDAYLRIARTPEAVGGLITFTLRSPMAPIYDRLKLPKGPSFGMKTTLICPFMYLAHYDLVTTPRGLAELAASHLDPDLLRLSCGTEPAEDIIAALAEALA